MGDTDVADDPFKPRRRAKGKVSRKRVRLRESDDETDILPSAKRQQEQAAAATDGNAVDVREKDVRGWQREEFAAGAKVEKADAAAERRDAGGSSNGKSKSGGASGARPFGPLSAPSHLRTSVRVDYQPDVCKDYKETGYCGFGDSCKFLHDRSDYKSGWQLDRDWAETQRVRRERLLRGEDPDKEEDKNDNTDMDEDGLPFACFICRGAFNTPVETLCKHYFCEDCALHRMKKHSTCAVCNTQLGGTLNIAHKLVAKIQRVK